MHTTNTTNTDRATGIKYGIISMHSIDPDFLCDHLWPGAKYVTCVWADDDRVLTKAHLRRIQYWKLRRFFAKIRPYRYTRRQRENAANAAKYIRAIYESAEVRDAADPVRWYYRHEGVELESSFDGTCFAVLKSPVVVRCRECSPCAPRAGDLNSLDPGGFDTYGLPSNWLTPEAEAEMNKCLEHMKETE